MSTTEQMDPVAVAQSLAGRDLSSEEIAGFYRIKEQLGLSDNDAIWTILLAFGQYKVLYEDIPGKIKDAAIGVMAEFKVSLSSTAEAAERAMIGKIERDSAAAVARLLDQAKNNAQSVNAATLKQRLTIWAAIACGVAFLVAGALIWGGYTLGQNTNAAELAWLNTNEGQAAKKFARLNNVERMLECPSPQSVVARNDGDYCSPYDTANKTVRMWRIK